MEMPYIIVKDRKFFLIFLISLFIYTGVGSAFTFSFQECEVFPTYNMLTKAFANRQLDIEHDGMTDVSYRDGKKYLYFGPLPAILRLPFFLLFKQGISTGWMISIYCAGIATLFYLSLCELEKDVKDINLSVTVFMLTCVMLFNGYSLTIITIPMIHSEAICAAMFFLMGAIYLYLRMRRRKFEHNYVHASFFGLCLAASFSCRFSYIFTSTIMGILFIVEYWQCTTGISLKRLLMNILIILSIGITILIALLSYNYMRFESFLDFGNIDITAYSRYFLEQGYFRYDHIPYNLWNIFFRLPVIDHIFPYIHLPGYIVETIEVKSLMPMKYQLLNHNELSSSIFLLLPISMFAFLPLWSIPLDSSGVCQSGYMMLILIFGVQVIMIALTVAITIRYFYDFLPIMLLCSFIGIVHLKIKILISDGFIIVMSAFSILLSFSVFLNAIVFYSRFVDYVTPILPYFFPK